MIRKILSKDQNVFECIEMGQISKISDKAIENNSDNEHVNIENFNQYSSININKPSFIDDDKYICNKIFETMNDQNNENLKNRDVNWFEDNDIEEDKFNSINTEENFHQMLIGMKRNEESDKLSNLDKNIENDIDQQSAPLSEYMGLTEYNEDSHKKFINNFDEDNIDLLNSQIDDTHENREKNNDTSHDEACSNSEENDTKQADMSSVNKNKKDTHASNNENERNDKNFDKLSISPNMNDSIDMDFENIFKVNKTRDICELKKKGGGEFMFPQTIASDFKDPNKEIPFFDIKKENGKNYDQHDDDTKIVEHAIRQVNKSADALKNNSFNKKENIPHNLRPEASTPNSETKSEKKNFMSEATRKVNKISDKNSEEETDVITNMDDTTKSQTLDKHKIKRNDLKHSLKKYHSNNIPRRQSSNDIYTFENCSNKKFHSTNNMEYMNNDIFEYSPEMLNRQGHQMVEKRGSEKRSSEKRDSEKRDSEKRGSEKRGSEKRDDKSLPNDKSKNDIVSETVEFEKNFKNLITDEHFSLTPPNRNEENTLNLYDDITDMSIRNERKIDNRKPFFKDNTMRSLINQARETLRIKEGSNNNELNKKIIELTVQNIKKRNDNDEGINNDEIDSDGESVHKTGVVDLYENNFKTILQRPLNIDQIQNMNNFQNFEKNKHESFKKIENENKGITPTNRLDSKERIMLRKFSKNDIEANSDTLLNLHYKGSGEKRLLTTSTDVTTLQNNNKTSSTSIGKSDQADADENERYPPPVINDNKIKRRVIDCKNDKLKWGTTQVIIDIDDTIRSSGGYKLFNYALGGVDAQYHRGETYPGSFQFIFELAMNKLPPECKPLLLSVLTARIPQVPITENSFLNVKFHEVAERRGIKNWGIDCDNKILYSTLKEWVWNETRGEKKFFNFKQLHKHVIHQNSLVRYIWIGDTGDMDKQAGEMMIKTFPQRMKAVFLHHVKGKDDKTLLPNDYFIKSVPVFFFRTYVGAATKAYAYNLIDKKGLTRVLVQAVLDLEKSRTPSNSSKWEDLIKDILLSDAIDELDKYNAETVNKTKKIISYRMKEMAERKL
ncbi:conserved Plasmodium protein, unknown function [Plasmodium vinckei vinckei]|uniref:Uncharacterized protein n=1 Tax=Plasmodium vinckei vinckei TaxID=54757 RepID=A0A449BUX0_PLAVN|nr:conserved Plasmodium protein, unknown function [Plasmodium vinckei vinckei]KEG02803.1 hypothetical protein YYE_02637 [Plasmodium vinckei vinckei]VEV57203.1 conserved Plasmodium protein, unknown function [Plasmodium vinckei vinckei]